MINPRSESTLIEEKQLQVFLPRVAQPFLQVFGFRKSLQSHFLSSYRCFILDDFPCDAHFFVYRSELMRLVFKFPSSFDIFTSFFHGLMTLILEQMLVCYQQLNDKGRIVVAFVEKRNILQVDYLALLHLGAQMTHAKIPQLSCFDIVNSPQLFPSQ